ncbi:uncharacterized protein LOC131693671 [Topomyia yanbarensis]|uniref:uncharacterized protein LOC131693671 n=1 Tax=Topomyia yanbarensis TaxID=2498891 RepID=UPI00273B9F52|nr:uncharacterized protein LOC131693671 [Topomyia yanbarensis]
MYKVIYHSMLFVVAKCDCLFDKVRTKMTLQEKIDVCIPIYNLLCDSVFELNDLYSSAIRDLRRRRRMYIENIRDIKKRQFLLLEAAENVTVDRIWTLKRTQYFWEKDCQVNGDEFLSRISECMDTMLRKAIPLEKRVAVALYTLGSSSEFRSIANLFGIGKSTVCVILLEFCREIWEILAPLYLSKLPLERDTIEDCVAGFLNLGFPQCLGAIDGCHIEIHHRATEAVDYYNYKGWYSTVLMALVDYRYRFLYINVGSPGRCNDSQVYESSLLKKHLTENPLMDELSKNICGVNVPVLIIGDSAFRFSKNLMKPYPFNVAGDELQKTYNFVQASTRRVVENAFGHIKARFRRIGKGIDNTIENSSLIIKACCVLHNFLNVNDDHLNSKWIIEQLRSEKGRIYPEQPAIIHDYDENAENIRHAIATFFSLNGISESSDGPA